MQTKRVLSNGLKIPQIGLGPGGMGYTPNAKPSKPVPRWNVPLRAWDTCMRPIRYHFKRAEYISAVGNGLRAGFRLIEY